ALRGAETIGRPLGSPAFLERLAALTGRDPRPRKRGPKPAANKGFGKLSPEPRPLFPALGRAPRPDRPVASGAKRNGFDGTGHSAFSSSTAAPRTNKERPRPCQEIVGIFLQAGGSTPLRLQLRRKTLAPRASKATMCASNSKSLYPSL